MKVQFQIPWGRPSAWPGPPRAEQSLGSARALVGPQGPDAPCGQRACRVMRTVQKKQKSSHLHLSVGAWLACRPCAFCTPGMRDLLDQMSCILLTQSTGWLALLPGPTPVPRATLRLVGRVRGWQWWLQGTAGL